MGCCASCRKGLQKHPITLSLLPPFDVFWHRVKQLCPEAGISMDSDFDVGSSDSQLHPVADSSSCELSRCPKLQPPCLGHCANSQGPAGPGTVLPPTTSPQRPHNVPATRGCKAAWPLCTRIPNPKAILGTQRRLSIIYLHQTRLLPRALHHHRLPQLPQASRHGGPSPLPREAPLNMTLVLQGAGEVRGMNALQKRLERFGEATGLPSPARG